MRLPNTCPKLYEKFLAGNFVLQKTDNPFSAIALDHGHEENNATLSSDMESTLRRWEVADPDVSWLLNEYEAVYHSNCSSEERKMKHHEDYPALKEIFLKDVSNLFKCFTDICNRSAEERLITLHNGTVMGPEIQNCLATILEVNEERYQMFCKHRIELCDVPLTDAVKCNGLHLPSSGSEDTKM